MEIVIFFYVTKINNIYKIKKLSKGHRRRAAARKIGQEHPNSLGRLGILAY